MLFRSRQIAHAALIEQTETAAQPAIAISCLIFAIAMFFSLRIEKFKKKHNLRTYRQIVAYDQGRSLSEIEEAEERGKAPYQRIILPVLFSLGIGAIALLFYWILLTFFSIK